MKKKVPGIFILLFLGLSNIPMAQTSKQLPKAEFMDHVIDFVIDNPGYAIELPDLYDSLSTFIPDDATEKLQLVQVLKQRGFKIINWERGNYPPVGYRIVHVSMQKDNCILDVEKIYYATIHKESMKMTERITCRKKQ